MNNIFSKKKCMVAGGDMRQIYLANLLSDQMDVYTFALEESDSDNASLLPSIQKINQTAQIPADCNYLILPMPATNGAYLNTPLSSDSVHIDILLNQICSDTLILAGKVSHDLKCELNRRSLKWIDYLQREELAVLNAVATAEGTIELLLSELPITVFGMNVLIVGSGRISKALRTRLKALGANVSVSARKYADLAWITADGGVAVPIHELPNVVSRVDAIINTVPAKILCHDILAGINRQTLVIDLASKPGGVDFEEANRLGLKTIWALSLPGKTAPISSGEIIFHTIEHIIEEEGKNAET